MAEKEDQRLGDKHLTQVLGGSYHMESTRTRWRQASPHSQGEKPPLRQPCLWPKCIGWGVCITPPEEPLLPIPLEHPIPPVLSPPSSPDSDTGASGSPSLEPIMGPGSSYEASISSDTE